MCGFLFWTALLIVLLAIFSSPAWLFLFLPWIVFVMLLEGLGF